MIRLFKHQVGFDPTSFTIYAVGTADTPDLAALLGDLDPITKADALDEVRRWPQANFYDDGAGPPNRSLGPIARCVAATARLIS